MHEGVWTFPSIRPLLNSDQLSYFFHFHLCVT